MNILVRHKLNRMCIIDLSDKSRCKYTQDLLRLTGRKVTRHKHINGVCCHYCPKKYKQGCRFKCTREEEYFKCYIKCAFALF